MSRRGRVPPHEFRFEIDRRLREVLTAFAAGERYINRVWTASADGYIDEVMTYLEKAQRQFAEAREAFAAQRG